MVIQYTLNMLLKDLQQKEREELAKVIERSEAAPATWKSKKVRDLPNKIDYSIFNKFVRHQGGYGCGIYSLAACWDIMNGINHPNSHKFVCSPNISANRILWAWVRSLEHGTVPNIPFDPGVVMKSEWQYCELIGCPTEGTELTNSNAVSWPTGEGNQEIGLFRLHPRPSDPTIPLRVEIDELKKWLEKGPIRLGVWGNHFVALVGYDDDSEKFKFINSWGDRWGDNGFGYINYSNLNDEVQGAEFIPIDPPDHSYLNLHKPFIARIEFTHSWRQDVYLWIGVDGKTSAKRIWPNEQGEDDSSNLTFTVTLPRGFSGPPASNNRIYLEVFDCGGHSANGGELIDFSVFEYNHSPKPINIQSGQLIKGPVHFEPHQTTRFYIP